MSANTMPNVDAGKTILVVEDEADLRDLISHNLKREGYACRGAADGVAALDEIRWSRPDLVILDRMLPGKSGDEVLAVLKRDPTSSSIPVIMLTAKSDESDELVGFALGVDDYVTKPFSMKALVARVAALLRRTDRHALFGAAPCFSVGPVALDESRYEVTVDGTPAVLTTTEFRLLRALMAARGRLKSRTQLIREALGPDVVVSDRTIDVHVAALRKKLGPASAWVQTIRGLGYAFRPPAQRDG